MRGRVLELAVTVEYVIDEVLSVVYARSEMVAKQLQFELVALLSLEQKLRILEDVLAEFELQLVVPDLMTTLRNFKKLRDLLAHGQVNPSTGEYMRVTTYRRGQIRVHEVHLTDVVKQVHTMSHELRALRSVWVWLMPEREDRRIRN